MSSRTCSFARVRAGRSRPTVGQRRAGSKSTVRSKAQRSSIGGAANAAGETFRTDVAARIAVHVLTQSPLPDLGPTHVPFRIHLESGSDVDDIEATMASGGTAWIQAKRRLALSARSSSPLASAFDQFVRQHLRSKSLGSSHDRLVLAYESSSAPIAVLRTVIRRFRDDSPSREQAAPDSGAQAALKILEKIVKDAWEKAASAPPTWAEFSHFMRFVVLWELREGDQSRVEVDPHQLLRRVVEDESDAAAAAEVLRSFVSTLAKDQRAANTNGLREALLNRGIRLLDFAGFAQRIEDHLCRLEQRWSGHRPLGVLADNMAWNTSLRSSEVFIPPRLQPRDTHVDFDLRSEDVLETRRRGRSVALLGHVGAGKSTFLLWCAARLAARHRNAPSEPVPIWLHARELQEGTWPDVLERVLPGAQRSGAATRWFLLVDGVDEVGIAVWSTLAALRRRFSTVVGLVVASRTTACPAPEDGFEVLRLVAWSPADAENFLVSWSRHDSDAVTSLRAQLGAPGGADLLSTPLTATAALLVARGDGLFPRSRAGLFGSITELMFRSWRQPRAGVATEFAQVRPVLLELARHAVRGEPLTTELVRKVLTSQGYGAALTIHDEVERHLGVLVQVGSNHFEFVHRSLAEHLVGCDALTATSEAFEELARSTWGREVVRHAVGICADLGDHKLAETRIRELAELAPEALFEESSLRAVSSVVAAAADLVFAGVMLSRETTEALAEAIMTVLTEEFSTWVGDTLVEHVRRVAQAGGTLWATVLSRMTSQMRLAQLDPMHWYLHAELSVEDWIVALFHRDPEVRAVAVDRLAPEIEQPAVQQALFQSMSDDGYAPHWVAPAARAGLAWRSLPRGPNTADAIRHMRGWLASPGTSAAGAAALALHQDEAAPRELAQALRWLSQSCDVPQAVIDDLMSTPEGECALREVWPDCATRRSLATDGYPSVPTNTVAGLPPSQYVRVRIVRACGPQLAAMNAETLEIVGSRSWTVVASELIASGCISRALELRFDDIPLNVQHELGALLLHSPEARQRVLHAWPPPNGRVYPGIALEPLIEAGDHEAAEIYRKYLPGSPYCWGLFRRAAPAGVLEHPRILPIAQELVRNAIERSRTPGRDGSRLAVTSTAVLLRNFAPAWSTTPEIVERIWSLLDTDQPERLVALLDATHHVELEVARIDDLFARVRADLESVSSVGRLDPQRAYRARSEVEWLEERGLVSRCHPMLRMLGGFRHSLGWTALAVLWPALSEDERMQASKAVAEQSIEVEDAPFPLTYLERFVRAAPDIWCDGLIAAIARGSSIDGTIGIQALALFPRNLQVRVARALRDSWHSALELPWRAYGHAGDCARPADTVRRLLFELGE